MIISCATKRNPDANELQMANIFRPLGDRSYLLTLKLGYVMSPSPQEIFHNNFIADGLEIAHGLAKVKWTGLVDLRRLKAPLSMLVELGKTHVQVYPNEEDKPAQGQELNRVCLATFGGLERINRQELMKACLTNGCTLMQVEEEERYFVVEIPHFTRYTFKDDEDSDEDKKERRQINEETRSRQPAEQEEGERIQNSNQQERQGLITECESSVEKQRPYSPDEKPDYGVIPKAILQILNDGSEELLNRLALDYSEPFYIRRLLSLYLICFRFQKCCFEFVRTKTPKNTLIQPLYLIERQRVIKQYERNVYLKNWLEWVAQEREELLVTQDAVYRAMALRKGGKLIEDFIQKDRFEDAQFLASAEDEFYRLEDYPRNLCKQLQSIAIGDMSPFAQEHWIFRVSIFMWYMNSSGEDQTNQKYLFNIESFRGGKNDLELEYRMLQMVLTNNPHPPLLSVTDDSLLIWKWLVSCKISQDVEAPTQSSPSDPQNNKYFEFRVGLLRDLMNKYSDPQAAMQLIGYENAVPEEQKKQLIAKFVNGKIEMLKSFHQKGIVVKQRDIEEFEASQQFEQQNYIKALSYCAAVSPKEGLSQAGYELVKNIMSFPQVICSYHLPTCRKVLAYLKKIINLDPEKGNFLNASKLYLEVRLQQISPLSNEFNTIMDMTLSTGCVELRERIMDEVFERVVSSPEAIVEMKKQDQLFERVAKEYREDRKKIARLLVARLEV